MPTSTAKPEKYVKQPARHLLQRHHKFFAVFPVPRSMWSAMGKDGKPKRRIVWSLGTGDLAEAKRLLPAAQIKFQREIDRCRAAPSGAVIVSGDTDAIKTPSADVTKAALRWRQILADPSMLGLDQVAREHHLAEALHLLENAEDDIQDKHGRAAAAAFAGIATGTATPLLLHVDAWLAEGGSKGPLAAKTAGQYKADLAAFAEWAAAAGVTTTEAVTRAVAGRWVTETMVATGLHWATGNRRITAAGSYWRYLRKRGHTEANPWAGASLSKGARREKTKRPPTEAEIVTLLACDDVDLKDAATWAALTGMRLSEIIGLRVSDVSGGWITIRHGKTAAAARRLPLHSGLVAIAERRTADKAPTVLLWDRNAATISKRYTRWRRACGIAMGGDGRQASVDFHSWRRFFQTEARNAGIDLGTVQAIVGQKPNNLVDGTYRGSVADALLRACVEAVKLPAE